MPANTAAPSILPPRSSGSTNLSLTERIVEQFGTPSHYVEMTVVLGFALVLAAVIAYHPTLRRKASTRAAVEQPKTLVMYGLVGALVGHVCNLNETMGFVIFGIGGLMRFRTDVGEAKDTGRVILVAVVGICCGVQTFLIAALATIFGFVLIWHLERQVIGSLDVMQIDPAIASEVSAAYRKLLRAAGCQIVGERKSPNPKKPDLSLVFLVPRNFDRDALMREAALLPEKLRGTVDWTLS
ncbi:MAG: hypothetical protein V3V08_03985 [Nannocystaceae bacterium]